MKALLSLYRGEIVDYEEIPDAGGPPARQEDEEAEPETRKLYRSRTDRSIAGICGGLADFFHVDATVMRLLMLFLIIFGGLSIWAYIILWIIIPEQPAPKFNINRKNR